MPTPHLFNSIDMMRLKRTWDLAFSRPNHKKETPMNPTHATAFPSTLPVVADLRRIDLAKKIIDLFEAEKVDDFDVMDAAWKIVENTVRAKKD